MDRELLQDSGGVNESFWDGLGVEFEAKYIFDFSGAPRGGPGGGLKQGSTRKKGSGNPRGNRGGKRGPLCGFLSLIHI